MNNTNNLKYSKLNIHKSRSLDFSDLSDWFPQTPKSIRKLSSINIRNNNNNVVKPKPRRTSRTVDQTSTTSTTSTSTQTQTQIDAKKTDIRSISTTRHHKDDSMNMDSSSPMKSGDDDEQEADQPDIAHHHLHEVAVVGSKGGDSCTSTATAGPVLRRNGSVSVSVKTRVLSMRRSSSVNSERYCRIHDQPVTLASPIDDVDEMNEDEKQKQKKKKKGGAGKILKVCKRFFGL